MSTFYIQHVPDMQEFRYNYIQYRQPTPWFKK